jgi:hypothetical protein
MHAAEFEVELIWQSALYSLSDLVDAGYSCERLLHAGCSERQLLEAGTHMPPLPPPPSSLPSFLTHRRIPTATVAKSRQITP